MSTATLTSKGQITLPKQVRDQLGLSSGDRVDFVLGANGAYTLVPVKRSVSALKGIIKRPGKAVSLAAMDAAIRQRAARKIRAGRK
ncbi:MAG: AbrB/MazE/SpoVT family DNA-binding domain-containing protein [Burkholderiales bacterium]|nr:AbrB/MazE/SpoVT family DNA-binding domain-containing protein [Burkholderiales bacterium]